MTFNSCNTNLKIYGVHWDSLDIQIIFYVSFKATYFILERKLRFDACNLLHTFSIMTLPCTILKSPVFSSSIKQILCNLLYWHFKLWLCYQPKQWGSLVFTTLLDSEIHELSNALFFYWNCLEMNIFNENLKLMWMRPHSSDSVVSITGKPLQWGCAARRSHCTPTDFTTIREPIHAGIYIYIYKDRVTFFPYDIMRLYFLGRWAVAAGFNWNCSSVVAGSIWRSNCSVPAGSKWS